MALSAPSIICLKSDFNNKYMRFQLDRNALAHSLLQFTAADAFDSYVQFEVVKASKRDDVFHLKCRFNNKFLVRWLPDIYWISASADRPNEDENSWNCTLFKPILVEDGDTKMIQLQHVQIGYNLMIWTAPNFDSYLMIGSSEDNEPNKRDLFSVLDWGALFQLPKRVAFKGDNNKYLGVNIGADKKPYLQYIFNDVKDPKVEHEIFQSRDGIVCIKNTLTGKFWTLGNDANRDRIFAEAEDPHLTNNVSGMFRPNVLGINTVAFLNMSKKWYCKRHDYDVRNTSYYAATTETAEALATLKITDLDKLN